MTEVATLIAFWVFSAAVQAMPEPDETSSKGYVFLYRFANTMAANITDVKRTLEKKEK